MAKLPRIKFEAILETDDPDQRDMLLKVWDGSGQWLYKTYPMALKRDPRKLAAALANLDIDLPEGTAAHTALGDILRSEPRYGRHRSTARTGWTADGRFVLPYRTCPEGPSPKIFHVDRLTPEKTPRPTGDLEAWNSAVTRLCENSAFATFALGVALSGPLLEAFQPQTGLAFNLCGESGAGKTTLLRMAQSVWESPANEQLVRSDITAAGLEELAARHNDGFLAIDELGASELSLLGSRGIIKTMAFTLRDGKGRVRSAAGNRGMGRGDLSWRIAVLTSSEQSLAALSSRARNAGERARYIDIAVPPRSSSGILNFLLPKTEAHAQKIMGHVERVLPANWGVAGAAFIKELVKLESRTETAKQYCDHWIAEARKELPTVLPQSRYIEAFGKIYAALRIAKEGTYIRV